MFCSKCGKTLKSDAANCPFCGEVVGDSRFEGNGYTAAQLRFVSGESEEEARKVVPYTRTTYTTSAEDGGGSEGEGDVYSRTTYRPLLKDEAPAADAPAPEAPQPEPEAPAPEATDSEAPEANEPDADLFAPEGTVQRRSERAGRADKPAEEAPAVHRRATIPTKEAPPEGTDPDDDIKIEPLRPVKQAGISPEVQQYIERMGQVEPKPKRSLKNLFGADTEGAEAPLPADAATDEAPEGIAPSLEVAAAVPDEPAYSADEPDQPDVTVAVNADGTLSVRRGAPAWLKPLTIVVSIAVILCVALWMLVMYFANDSKLEGVGYDLRDAGLKLVKDETIIENRTALVMLMQSDPTGEQMSTKLAQTRSEISALMPESPLKNDQLFVDALLRVQDIIDNAATTESYAVLNKSDPIISERFNEEALAQWAEANNAITRLEDATSVLEIQGIMESAIDVLSTPEPTAEPGPTPNPKVLKRGLFNDPHVKRLQERLKQLGWFKGRIDADYGPYTVVSVERFQQAVGIEPADGITDHVTWNAIFADDAPTVEQASADRPESTPTLSPGTGADDATESPIVSDPGDNVDVDDYVDQQIAS